VCGERPGTLQRFSKWMSHSCVEGNWLQFFSFPEACNLLPDACSPNPQSLTLYENRCRQGGPLPLSERRTVLGRQRGEVTRTYRLHGGGGPYVVLSVYSQGGPVQAAL
jgi:hypothetical protein